MTPPARGVIGGPVLEPPTDVPRLSELLPEIGVTRREAFYWETLAKIPDVRWSDFLSDVKTGDAQFPRHLGAVDRRNKRMRKRFLILFAAPSRETVKVAQSRGWKPIEVAELLGDSLRTIERHYAVPTVGEMREAARTRPLIG